MDQMQMINRILSECGTEPYAEVSGKEKRSRFERLCGHAGVLMRCAHGNLTKQKPEEGSTTASLTLDIPLPIVVLNGSIRTHFAMIMALSDSVALTNAGGCLQICCIVVGVSEK